MIDRINAIIMGGGTEKSRWVRPAAIGGTALALSLFLFALLYDPGIPANVADGSYENDCCGTLLLRDGRLFFETGVSVDYIVAEDQAGPYVLPDVYIGPWEERGFEIDGTRSATKVRLDAIPNPTSLVVVAYGQSYVFKRAKDGK